MTLCFEFTRTRKDILSEDETKDLHQAIELSLRRFNCYSDTGSSYIDEDEALARALQESLNLSGSSRTYSGSRRVVHFHHEVCNVCEGSVNSSKCVKLPYWGQFLCLEHWFDQTPRCFCCERFKPSDAEYLDLGDGRKICSDCYCTAVMDKSTCEVLWKEVHTFFRKLKLNIREGSVPCYMVDTIEMAKVSTQPIHSPTYGAWGRALTNREQKIMTINKFSLEGGKIEMAKILSSRDHPTSVLILFGFPRVVAGAVMAHELMHAWMRQQGYANDRKVEEGICHVLAHTWLDWFTEDDRDACSQTASYMRNLKNYWKIMLIEMDCRETYGDGFRDAKFAVEKYGLKYTLDYVAKTKTLPQS